MSWIAPTVSELNLPRGRVRTVSKLGLISVEKAIENHSSLEKRRERNRRWRARSGYAYYLKNKARIDEKNRLYREANRQKVNKRLARYRDRNRLTLREYDRKYYATNEKRRQALAEHCRAYRAKQKAEKNNNERTWRTASAQ